MLRLTVLLTVAALCRAVPQLSLVSWTAIPDESGTLAPFSGTADRMAIDIDQSTLYIVGTSQGIVQVLDISNRTNTRIVKTLTFNAATDGIPTDVAVCRNSNTNVKEVAITLSANTRLTDGHVEVYELWETFNTGMDRLTREPTESDPISVKYTSTCAKLLVLCQGLVGQAGNSLQDPVPHVDIYEPAISGVTKNTINFLTNTGSSNARYIYRNSALSGHSVISDLEPSDMVIAPNNDVFVTFYKNNAIGKFTLDNINNAVEIYGLGVKDWNNWNSDTSDLDGASNTSSVNMTHRDYRSFHQPKRIDLIQYDADTSFLATANTGGRKVYTSAVEGVDFTDSERARLSSNPWSGDLSSSTIADYNDDAKMGRLWVTILQYASEGYDSLFSRFNYATAFGARSWSLWNVNDLSEVFDSQDSMAYHMANYNSTVFNGDCFGSTNTQYTHLDKRSDDMGLEPNAITHTTFDSKTLMAIGSGKSGGIWLYYVEEGEVSAVPTGTFQSFQRFGPGTSQWGSAYDAGTAGIHYINDLIFYTDGTETYLVGLGSQLGAIAIFQVVESS